MYFSSQSLDALSAQEKRLLLARLLKEKARASKSFPLSFAQQRLWFLEQLEPGNVAYVVSLALQITGPLHIAILEKSLQEVVRRHESLRTVFVVKKDQPMQVVLPECRLPFPIFDLQTLADDLRLAEACTFIEREAATAFDLTAGPLLRISLLRFNDRDHVLTLSVHHIISDGWSVQLLIHELVVLYEAFSEGKASPLAPLKLQYGDFAVWQRSWLQGEVLQAHLDYWRRQLQGVKPLELTMDRPRSAIQERRNAAHYQVLFAVDLVEALVKLGKQQNATFFTTLLTAFQVLLYRSSGQTDIVIGTDIANRLNVETEALIGFFVNVLALRTHVSGLITFQSLLYQVRQMVLDAYTYQNLPFETLIEHLRLERHTQQTPLIQVLFVLQNTPQMGAGNSSIQLKSFVKENTVAKFDLALLCRQSPEGLRVAITYCSDLFERSTIVTMMRRFEVLLRSIVQYPDRPLDTLEIYTDDEKALRTKAKQERRTTRLREVKSAKGQEVDSVQESEV